MIYLVCFRYYRWIFWIFRLNKYDNYISHQKGKDSENEKDTGPWNSGI